VDLGRAADHKLSELREWIQQQPSSAPSYMKEVTPSRQYAQMGTLVTSLNWYDLLNISCSFNLNTRTAYILNLRGSDIWKPGAPCSCTVTRDVDGLIIDIDQYRSIFNPINLKIMIFH
jgi:hypothetical protein